MTATALLRLTGLSLAAWGIILALAGAVLHLIH